MRDSQRDSTRGPDPWARYWTPAALCVVALAFVLRLPWPSGWWLNPDEGIYFQVLTRPTFAEFWAEAMATAHPPLYFLILRAIGALTTDFAWLRSPAFFAGIAAVYAFAWLGRELGGTGRRSLATGLLAGTLLAVSPRAIVLSQVVRPYALLLLLMAGAACFLLRALRTGAARDLTGYALFASLGLTLHYSAAAALGVFGLIVLTDGVRRGFGRPRWRRVALVQLVPALTLAVLYAWHLRSLMGSAMAGQALEGWLSTFMVHRPADAWLGTVGVHSSLVGDRLAAAAAVLTVGGLAWAAWAQRWDVLVLAGGALALAVAGAVWGLYPLGATRHTAWVFVFVTPVLAWTIVEMLAPAARFATSRTSPASGADAATSAPRALAAAAPALTLAAVLAGSGPLRSLLDSPRRPREISEQVLRVAHVQAMAELLKPDRDPRIVLMSKETYQLLAPVFLGGWTAEGVPRKVVAVHPLEPAPESRLRWFRWGVRDVIVLPGRDFAARSEELGSSNHLHTAIRRAAEAFGIDPPRPAEAVLVVAGGWYSRGMDALVGLARAAPELGTSTFVPGLIAVELNYDAYRTALGLEAQ